MVVYIYLIFTFLPTLYMYRYRTQIHFELSTEISVLDSPDPKMVFVCVIRCCRCVDPNALRESYMVNFDSFHTDCTLSQQKLGLKKKRFV